MRENRVRDVTAKEWRRQEGVRDRRGEGGAQEISDNSLGEGGRDEEATRATRAKDQRLVLFHEGDTHKQGSKGRGLSILRPEVTLSSNLFLEPNGVLEDSPFN